MPATAFKERPAHLRVAHSTTAMGSGEHREAMEELLMSSDPADVLNVLAGQLSGITRSLDTQAAIGQQNAVTLATVAGDVKSLVSRADSSDKDRDDHETRIRDLERSRPDPKLEDRLQKLERMLWVAAGAALAGGGTIGTVAGKLLGG